MRKFSEIIGQNAIIDHLQNALRTGSISHAYMISGDAGSGRGTIASIFAAAMQCGDLQEEQYGDRQEESGRSAEERSQGSGMGAPARIRPRLLEPCGKCLSCIQAQSGNQPDIITVTHAKPNSISVDEIRRMRADLQIKPYAGPHKIYIIPDAEKLTIPAQNALLKTLEEPPEYAVLILLTTSTDAMLETIRSRCVLLDLKPVEDAKVRQYLMEQCEIPDYEADICVAFAQGNIGKAVSLAGSEDFRETMDRAVRILTHIRDWEMEEISAEVKALVPYKLRIDDLLDLFAVWYRDVLFFKATRQIDGIIFREQTSAVRKAARESSYEGVQMILDAIRKAKDRLRANVNFELTIELLLLAMKEN